MQLRHQVIMDQRRTTLLLSVARFASAIGRLSLGPLLPKLSKHLGFGSDDAPFLLSSYSTGYALTQIAGGFFADKYGAGNVLAACCAASCAILLALGYVFTTVSYWKLAYFLLGVTAGPLFPSCQVAVNVLTNRAEALAIIDASAAAGSTVASLAPAVPGYSLVFLGAAVLLGLVSSSSRMVLGEKQQQHRSKQQQAGSREDSVWKPSIVRIYLCHSVDNFTKYSLNAWAATIFVERFAATPGETAIILGLQEAVSVVARLVAVRYIKTTGIRNSALAFGLQGLALQMAFTSHSLIPATAFLVISSCVSGIHSTGFRLGYTSGKSAGVGNTIASCASVIGPAIMSFVAPAKIFGWVNMFGAVVAWSATKKV